MGRNIPKGWSKYGPLGEIVAGTSFLPFKVPLTQEVCQRYLSEEEWWTPSILLEKQPNLKYIIDLTNTDKYYSPQVFTSCGVAHHRLNIFGGGKVPPDFKLRQFVTIVDGILQNDSDALIGVHCTHGLNRTGYFICYYMVTRMQVSPQDAVLKYETARGYPFERENYRASLLSL